MTRTIAAILLLASLALPAAAASNKPHGSGEGATAGEMALATFTEIERHEIVQYFQARPVATKRLPPGIAKNLARGKPLPPGIAKKFLPQDLSLPPNSPRWLGSRARSRPRRPAGFRRTL